MTDTSNGSRPDAFKALMAEAQAKPGQPELAHQSLGRPLSEAEVGLAEALMAVYAEGVFESDAVAAALTARGTVVPSTRETTWTAQSLEGELRALNVDLDAAYQENGFGA